MNLYFIRSILLCIFMLLSAALQSQIKVDVFTPMVGDTLPDYTFSDLRNFSNDKVSIRDFRGKWLILDFWSKDCSGCLKSFPKMNQLHERFKDSVSVLMVGNVDDVHFPASGRVLKREKPTKLLYDRLEKLYSLKFVVSFDSILARNYGLSSLPYILVVDPKGVVQGITTSVDQEIISSFLAGHVPILKKAYTETQINETKQKDIIKSLTHSDSSEFRNSNRYQTLQSSISIYDRLTMTHGTGINFSNQYLSSSIKAATEGVLEVLDVNLYSLYYVAFFGANSWNANDTCYYRNFSKKIIFKTKDSSQFTQRKPIKYAYRLSMPKQWASHKFMQKIMQNDLEVYFGFKGRIEKHQMPVYYLQIADSKKAAQLASKGESNRFKENEDVPKGHQLFLNNSTMDALCSRIGAYNSGNYPILNGTNFKENIDIDLRAYIYDLNEINQALNIYGLKLVKGTKEMETIVISDSVEYQR